MLALASVLAIPPCLRISAGGDAYATDARGTVSLRACGSLYVRYHVIGIFAGGDAYATDARGSVSLRACGSSGLRILRACDSSVLANLRRRGRLHYHLFALIQHWGEFLQSLPGILKVNFTFDNGKEPHIERDSSVWGKMLYTPTQGHFLQAAYSIGDCPNVWGSIQ